MDNYHINMMLLDFVIVIFIIKIRNIYGNINVLIFIVLRQSL